jgi:hypothetical protein
MKAAPLKIAVPLAATALVLASTACVQPPDPAMTSYGAAPAPYWPQPAAPALYQPPPYQPPPLSATLPSQPAPLPVVAGPTNTPPVRYVPPPPFASASLLTPPPSYSSPSFSSPSLIGPQRVDWKPGGGF